MWDTRVTCCDVAPCSTGQGLVSSVHQQQLADCSVSISGHIISTARSSARLTINSCCCCHFYTQSPEAQERNQLAWLAFGAGPRLCIGYKFALNEAKTVLVSLWQRYDFSLDTTRTSDPPKLRPGITLGYRDGLWCKVMPRACNCGAPGCC